MKLIESVQAMYENKREFTILQWIYMAIALVSLVFAGLMALINQSFGIGLLVVPLVAIVAFCMNTITWALVRLVLDALKGKKATAKKK